MKRDTIKILHVYDRYLNIYADRGNMQVLAQRATWRGINTEIRTLALGETFEPGEVDLIYIGGGQDKDQRQIADHLVDDLGDPIRSAVSEGTAVLAVCGGYQLLGNGYLDVSGTNQPGVGLWDTTTASGTSRLIGNVSIRAELPAIGAFPAVTTIISGFENHAGRTTLGADARPLGTVIAGYGNDGSSGYEGCRLHHAVGTYLHGPLLPRNPEFADWLLTAALAHASGSAATEQMLAPVPDLVTTYEKAAAERAQQRAATDHKRR